jgi:hypothetical protein
VSNRVLSFRAALLLIISSAAIIWPISYWLPLPNYLAVLNTSEYEQFATTLRGIVIVYILFLVMNIVSAVLAFTRLDYRIRAALLAIPTLSLVIAPLLLIIPNAQHFTDRGYFTVLQAIYRLLRFTTPLLLVAVLVVTLLCFALNVFALVLMFRDKSESIDEMPKETRKAYATLAGILSLATVVSLVSGATAAQNRELDRQACDKYAALPVPETDEGVPVFLSDIQLYGEAAGTDQVKTPMVTFAEKSRQYYSLYYSDEETNIDLDALLVEVKAAKDQITQVCTEYSVD